MAQLVQPDGRFLYRHMLPDPSVTDRAYNNARHIASVWAMVDWEHEGWSLPEYAEALSRASNHMIGSIFVPFGQTDGLCVIDEGVVKIGAVALAIAASLRLYHRNGDDADLQRALRLGRYIALQRRDDGDFIQIRTVAAISVPHPTRDDMLTGQAVFGMALLGEATGDELWVAPAMDSARQLSGRDHGIASQSHWMLYALEALHRCRKEGWLLDYARRIAESMLADTSYRKTGESTPVACRTEGLLAFVRMARAAGSGSEAARQAMKHIAQNLRLQLKYYDPSGAFIRSLAFPEVRIDYIVHNVIGFLGYARLGR